MRIVASTVDASCDVVIVIADIYFRWGGVSAVACGAGVTAVSRVAIGDCVGSVRFGKFGERVAVVCVGVVRVVSTGVVGVDVTATGIQFIRCSLS